MRADASAQYLNPITEADAASTGCPPYNGPAPNNQHTNGVAAAVARFTANGYTILSSDATAVFIDGLETPRVYDFVVQDPETDLVWGVEVKTTLYDTIFFSRAQVDKDVAIYESGGGYSGSLGKSVTRVAYIAYCNGCSSIDLRSLYLRNRLHDAGINIETDTLP